MHHSFVQVALLILVHSAIFNSNQDPSSAVSQPILQCVQVKPLQGQEGAPERHRVVFSDINNFVQSMLATRKSHRIVSKPSKNLYIISGRLLKACRSQSCCP